jgi:hypothetical protein
MPKITGQNSEVRMATTEGGLATAPVVTEVQSIEWDRDPDIGVLPKGLGMGRLQDVTEGLITYTGNITKWYNKDPVVPSPGTTTFAEMCEECETGSGTRLYIRVDDLDTAEVHTLKKILGKYHVTKPIDGPQEETFDFFFEELIKT